MDDSSGDDCSEASCSSWADQGPGRTKLGTAAAGQGAVIEMALADPHACLYADADGQGPRNSPALADPHACPHADGQGPGGSPGSIDG